MVRFGNVLVLRFGGALFRIRLLQVDLSPSHTRRLSATMTISEAASLVLQASELAKGVICSCLAWVTGSNQHWLSRWCDWWPFLQDDTNPGGDIEIICSGLRPGEKLYELLIDAESHPCTSIDLPS